MPIWLVRATWIEDDTEATEKWEVHAATGHEAIQSATAQMRYQPHHVEARRLRSEAGEEARSAELPPGQMRHIPSR